MAIPQYDALTGALLTMGHFGNHVHAGELFYIERPMLLDTNESYYAAVITPCCDVRLHSIWETYGSGVTEVRIYEDCEVDISTGDVRTALNCDRCCNKKAATRVIGNVPPPTSYATLMHVCHYGQLVQLGTVTSILHGGKDERTYEVILKESTTYVWHFKSFTEDNRIMLRAYFIESPAKGFSQEG